jgi:ATP:corrinoid adenosyltransferase
VGDEQAQTYLIGRTIRTRPDRIEVVVTGRAARARVVVPVGTDPDMADT